MTTRMIEKLRRWRRRRNYPYTDGDVVVLGPETIIDLGQTVIAHKGENYYRQGRDT